MNLSAPRLSAEDFVNRWKDATLSERASYQEHFRDVCHLVGARTPTEVDVSGEDYSFEYGLKKTNGAQGYADVFLRGHFAIEYKQKNKDLDAAYVQLQQYRENLNNPPLLIVCDINRWVIRTNFTNAPTVKIEFTNEDILKPRTREFLRRTFSDPEGFHPDKNKLDITADVAATFKSVVDDALTYDNDPDRVARFLTRLVFCLFVEDIGLLPKRDYDGILTHIIREARRSRDSRTIFRRYVIELFQAMATGGNVLMADIPYFNGSIFEGDENEIVPLGGVALNALDQASDRDWAHVEPSIFGTIFERTLDQKKRVQLGAHYTHPDDIRLIVEPVLMQPLRRAWEATLQEAEPLRQQYVADGANRAQKLAAERELKALRERMLDRVRTITVLDPACGSGNFLYISLRLLLDLEKEIITHPFWAGLPEERIGVRPTQLYGIERNEIAHALASVVVWIGYLQWRHENGYHEVIEPILDTMRDHIVQMDAILAYDAEGTPVEPKWVTVDVIVGNPPFLGAKKLRGELGEKYSSDLRRLYVGRVPGGADLVTYWFERARSQLEAGETRRVGMLATNSIRDGASNKVIQSIVECGNIFMAWSDREWILEGAAVRVSMLGFDIGNEATKVLNGATVSHINSDLTAGLDITSAERLSENSAISSRGFEPGGPFELTQQEAERIFAEETAARNIIVPIINAQDVTDRWSYRYVIDFNRSSENAVTSYPLTY